jgi:hypothetical protein
MCYFRAVDIFVRCGWSGSTRDKPLLHVPVRTDAQQAQYGAEDIESAEGYALVFEHRLRIERLPVGVGRSTDAFAAEIERLIQFEESIASRSREVIWRGGRSR